MTCNIIFTKVKSVTLLFLVFAFSGCLIEGIPSEPDNINELLKGNPEKITEINLDYREIESYTGFQNIVLGDLKKLGKFVNLEKLTMPLIGIPTNDIFYLKKLEDLDLSDSPGKYDSNNIIKNRQYLHPEYGFDELPSDIKNLTNLKKLYIGGCNINKLIPELFELRNLEILDISGTAISEIPPDISKLQKLEELYIQGTQIKDIPEQIISINNLKIYHSGLDDKKIAGISSRSGIKFINVSYSVLFRNDFPDNIDSLFKNNPEKVTEINLDFMKVVGFVGIDKINVGDLKKIDKFVNLEKLNMPYWGIPTNGIFYLKKLTYLNLSWASENYSNKNRESNYYCKTPEYGFDVLPPEVKNLINLKELDLSYSRLKALNPELFDLKNLEILNIRNTLVNELPSDISKLQKLKELNIIGTQITDLPESIIKCENLEIIHSGLDKKRVEHLSKISNLKFSNPFEY